MEYNDLTSKLHNLSLKEQQLKEKLRLQSIDAAQYDQDPEDLSSSPIQDHNESQNVPISPLVTSSVTSTNTQCKMHIFHPILKQIKVLINSERH